jgi:hypothetical protein
VTNNKDRIEKLIAGTTDPVQHATLLVLSNIDVALEANTAATQAIAKDFSEHRVKFDAHVLDEQKLLSGVTWAWWSATGLMGVIVALILIIMRMYASTIEMDAQQIKINTLRLQTIEVQITDLLRRQAADDALLREKRGEK